MASANAPSLKGAHAQRGLCEPWESTTLIRTLPKRAKRQHSDTRENPSLCFQQFTPTPRKHGLAAPARNLRDRRRLYGKESNVDPLLSLVAEPSLAARLRPSCCCPLFAVRASGG